MISSTKSIIHTLLMSNTFNFVIVLILLFAIYKFAKLGDMLSSAISKVKNNIQKADDTVKESIIQLDNANAKKQSLNAEIENIQSLSKENTIAFCQQIEHNTQISIENIEKSIEHLISIEEKKINNKIIEDTIKQSVAKAEETLINKLKENPELHNDFIMQSLDELDKVKL